MNEDFWGDAGNPEERASRRQAYERLVSAARRAGLPIERLHDMLTQLATNNEETRRFLAEEVYGVPDSLLDDVLRTRLKDQS